MSVTKEDIKKSLKELGIIPGDIVLVHSSMKSMGYVEGGPEAVIESFLETVGSTGTLVMPTLSQKDFANAYRDWHMERPSDVGLLTEVFRKYPGVHRSNQETHSVAAKGALAEKITEGHTAFGPRYGAFGDYAFSYSSPWQKMYDWHAKVVFIGVNMRCNTIKHMAEYRLVEKYLKRVEGMPEEEKIKSRIRHFDKDGTYHDGIWCTANGLWLHDLYQEFGLTRKTTCGDAVLYSLLAHECVDLVEDILEKEAEKWLSEEMRAWMKDAELLACASEGK